MLTLSQPVVYASRYFWGPGSIQRDEFYAEVRMITINCSGHPVSFPTDADILQGKLPMDPIKLQKRVRDDFLALSSDLLIRMYNGEEIQILPHGLPQATAAVVASVVQISENLPTVFYAVKKGQDWEYVYVLKLENMLQDFIPPESVDDTETDNEVDADSTDFDDESEGEGLENDLPNSDEDISVTTDTSSEDTAEAPAVHG